MADIKALSSVRFTPRPILPGAMVSVVIPCYNYARYLPDAVNSVLSQAEVDVEVIVVDDASQDESAAVARSLAEADGRVRVLVNAVNSGAVATFNRGLAEVRGDYIVRLDADDLLTPGSLQRAVAVMQRLPNVGMVFGHPIHFEGETLPPARQLVGSWTVWAGRDWLAIRCLEGSNTITSPEVVMRSSVVDLVGGQRELAHAHDMEMWLRIAAVSDVAYVTGVDQAWHREHEGSLSTTAALPVEQVIAIREAFDELLSGETIAIEGSAALHRESRRAVASLALDLGWRQLDQGSDPEVVRPLLDFAESSFPEITSTKAWSRLSHRTAPESGPPSVVARIGGVLPRLSRQLQGRARFRRWTKSGEYVRLVLTDGVMPASVDGA